MSEKKPRNRLPPESTVDLFAQRPLYLFLAPRYWGIWVAVAIMRASTILPYPLQMRFGRALGRLMHAALRKRRLIANRNISLCFPDADRATVREMVRDHFDSLGMSLAEMALGWWGSDKKIERLVTIEGIENLHAVLENGKGAILVTAHFTSIEAAGRLFAKASPPFKAMYRTNRNHLFDEILRRGRLKSAASVIAKDDVKTMLRTLKTNMPVMYAPDQSYRRKLSALVPFFSVPSMTNIATSHIARITGAPVLPYLPIRLPDNKGYLVSILPPIDNFPSDDPAADAERYHRVIEQCIRKDPSQYYWVHRRFKNRPAPLEDAYANLQE